MAYDKSDYQYYFNYYNHDKVKDFSFRGYIITTNNPGNFLLIITLIACISCFLLGLLVFPGSPFNIIYKIWRGSDGGDAGSVDEDTKKRVQIQKGLDNASPMKKKNSKVKQFLDKRKKNRKKKESIGSHYTKHADDSTVYSSSTRNSGSHTSGRSKPVVRVCTPEDIEKHVPVKIIIGPRGGKKKYSANELRSVVTLAEKRKTMIRARTPANNTTHEKVPVRKVEIHSQDVNIDEVENGNKGFFEVLRPSTAEADGRLDLNDLTHFFTSSNYDEKLNNHAEDDTKRNLHEEFLDNGSVDQSVERNTSMWIEWKEIQNLATPWIIRSIISYGTDIVVISVISHYMGLRAMICYSNVWYLTGMFYMLNSAFYSAIYKRVNMASALETDNGYVTAGKYMKLGIFVNALISIPVAVGTVFCIPLLMSWMGYEDSIVELSRGYTIIIAIHNFLSYSSYYLNIVVDLEGHAKFVTIYEFWESILCMAITLISASTFGPSLITLGVVHLIQDCISYIYYFNYVINKKGWYKGFMEGLTTPILSLNYSTIPMLLSSTLTYLWEEFVGNLSGIAFTIFATYQGSAEVSTMILLSYVWAFVELAPESYAEAAATRIARHLSRGRKELAQAVSFYSLKIITLIALFCSFLLYAYGRFFVWCLSLDDTLETMLLEAIPYLVICQTFITVGETVSKINSILHIHKQATFLYAIVTVFIMVPIAAVNTYVFNYNIEGLTSAQCIGYTAMGVMNLVIFMNANWDKAVKKAQESEA